MYRIIKSIYFPIWSAIRKTLVEIVLLLNFTRLLLAVF